ncbi:MAG: serine/threonine protein kinase, partial [Deltaproteobacteria bacterium]|nr:serine/threonine protein kinase [Deltaproteobacteria bacterium]
MLSGDTIGKYRLVNRLGHGGMGEVWLATASGYGGFAKKVVLKTLLPELARDPLFIEMLAHEARICATLSHPNLIEVFDFSEHGGIYLLAMEHVMGRPLHHIMRAAKAHGWPIPAWFALRIAWECCLGLECAHQQGIIHCDLSPSNVMVTYTGVTKILDFGVAHSSARGPKADRLKGKFSYMAPERISSLVTDRRSDIYALGVMLYLLFTGQLPFAATSDSELLQKIVHEKPRPPSELVAIDPRIEQLILRAMQSDPLARHQDVAEMLAALTPCLESELGAYGQHDVATFVTRLFEQDAGPRQLPPVVDLVRVDGEGDRAEEPIDQSTSQLAELDSFDIEIESSVLEVAREASRPLR